MRIYSFIIFILSSINERRSTTPAVPARSPSCCIPDAAPDSPVAPPGLAETTQIQPSTVVAGVPATLLAVCAPVPWRGRRLQPCRPRVCHARGHQRLSAGHRHPGRDHRRAAADLGRPRSHRGQVHDGGPRPPIPRGGPARDPQQPHPSPPHPAHAQAQSVRLSWQARPAGPSDCWSPAIKTSDPRQSTMSAGRCGRVCVSLGSVRWSSAGAVPGRHVTDQQMPLHKDERRIACRPSSPPARGLVATARWIGCDPRPASEQREPRHPRTRAGSLGGLPRTPSLTAFRRPMCRSAWVASGACWSGAS